MHFSFYECRIIMNLAWMGYRQINVHSEKCRCHLRRRTLSWATRHNTARKIGWFWFDVAVIFFPFFLFISFCVSVRLTLQHTGTGKILPNSHINENFAMEATVWTFKFVQNIIIWLRMGRKGRKKAHHQTKLAETQINIWMYGKATPHIDSDDGKKRSGTTRKIA